MASSTAPAVIERRHIYRIAAEADVDDRTVVKVLRGETTAYATNARTKVAAALRRLGWESLLANGGRT